MADIKPWFRLGVVTPHALNDTLPYEFYLMAPPGVMVMTAGLELKDYTDAAVSEQLPLLDRRIDQMLRRGAQRIVLSGVPLAAALGRTKTRAFLLELAARWKTPTDTDLEAIIAGALSLGITRIAIATRWEPHVNQGLTDYLAEAGITVVGSASSARSIEQNAGLDDETGMRLATDLGSEALSVSDAAEGLIMPGGRWITAHAIRELEAKFSRPVITNHSASLWAALKSIGYHGSISGWGRLLSSTGG